MTPSDIDVRDRAREETFLERLRAAVGLPYLLTGVMHPGRKMIEDIRTSLSTGSTPEGTAALLREATELTRRFFAPDSALPGKDGAAIRSARFPVWLAGRAVLVGVGRPVGSVHPVVACSGTTPAQHPHLQDTLALGLAHVAETMVRQAYARASWPAGLAEATLQTLSMGYFVVDANGRIVHDHSGGDRTSDAAWITAQGRLSFRSEPERAALQAAIADAVGRGTGSIISVPTHSGALQMAAVAPLQLGTGALAIVVFEARATDHGALREHFCRTYALTRSEAIIAREVLDGHAPADIAERTRMSLETVRSYLKRVLAKTGTHRQSELVALYFSSILPVSRSIARADNRGQSAGR